MLQQKQLKSRPCIEFAQQVVDGLPCTSNVHQGEEVARVTHTDSARKKQAATAAKTSEHSTTLITVVTVDKQSRNRKMGQVDCEVH